MKKPIVANCANTNVSLIWSFQIWLFSKVANTGITLYSRGHCRVHIEVFVREKWKDAREIESRRRAYLEEKKDTMKLHRVARMAWQITSSLSHWYFPSSSFRVTSFVLLFPSIAKRNRFFLFICKLPCLFSTRFPRPCTLESFNRE